MCPRDAVIAGLEARGVEVRCGYAPAWERARHRAAVAIVWSVRGRSADIRASMRRLGGRTIVMENGYLADARGRRYFSWGFDGHNGAGDHRNRGAPRDRWRRLGLAIDRWRKGGRHILVCAQRGHGPPEVSHDSAWPERVIAALERHTRRPIVFRPHPGKPDGPWERLGVAVSRGALADALEDCWAVVVYKSTAAIEALRRGVPVFALGSCMASPLANADLAQIEHPARPLGRRRFFAELAYAQWNADELARGEAWDWLMHAGGDLP